MLKLVSWCILFLFFCKINYVELKTEVVTNSNYLSFIKSKRFVLLLFHAEWCPFSRAFSPVFDEVDKYVQNGHLKEALALGKVDGTVQNHVMAHFSVDKFPVLLLVKDGKVAKSQFYGHRTFEKVKSYLEENTRTIALRISSLHDIDSSNLNIYALVKNQDSHAIGTFDIFADKYYGLCKFYVMSVDTKAGNSMIHDVDIYFYTENLYYQKEQFNYNNVLDAEALEKWIVDKCHPIVSEVTFANIQEFINIKKPLFCLFYDPSNTKTLPSLRKTLESYSSTLKDYSIIFANGITFKKALTYLGRTEKDLPLFAIDDFEHIYYYGQEKDLLDRNKLVEFIHKHKTGDLRNKLHHEMITYELQIVQDKNGIHINAHEVHEKLAKKSDPIKPHGIPKDMKKHVKHNDLSTIAPNNVKPSMRKSIFERLKSDSYSYSHLKSGEL